MKAKVLVTGATGFIGSHFVKYILNNTDWEVVGFSRNSDQKNLKRLDAEYSIANHITHLVLIDNNRFNLRYGDLSNPNDISGLCEDIDYVVNFAAKTFVDHSIKEPYPFIQSNIVGTFNLLEEVRRYKDTIKRYIQVSTDEVYGAIIQGAYKEDSRLNPTNVYSATKAAGDMLALSYHNTYHLPIIITRTENNFGSYQHPQKAMPKFIKYALNDEPLPVYGDGEHRRMWLYVEDHCSAIHHLLTSEQAIFGEIYHIAGEQELSNNQLAIKILKLMGKPLDRIKYIEDYNIRPGHDRRYALNTEKLRATGWKPKWSLDSALKETVDWYVNNQWWL